MLSLALTLVGCGIHLPSDPQHTLDRITGGTVRAGASIEGDLVREDRGVLSGSEVLLVDGFAEAHHARVKWTVGSEETLVTMLEEGKLDLAVGGFTTDTTWAPRAGITRGYPGIDGADGRELVMLVPLGENRLLSSLERYLDAEVGK